MFSLENQFLRPHGTALSIGRRAIVASQFNFDFVAEKLRFRTQDIGIQGSLAASADFSDLHPHGPSSSQGFCTKDNGIQSKMIGEKSGTMGMKIFRNDG